jgi:hypothetical protein
MDVTGVAGLGTVAAGNAEERQQYCLFLLFPVKFPNAISD